MRLTKEDVHGKGKKVNIELKSFLIKLIAKKFREVDKNSNELRFVDFWLKQCRTWQMEWEIRHKKVLFVNFIYGYFFSEGGWFNGNKKEVNDFR